MGRSLPFQSQLVNRSNYTGWLPFIDTFRTFCIMPPPEMKVMFNQVRELH